MSKREHSRWIARHQHDLEACGLPRFTYETVARWEDFLANGEMHFHRDVTGFTFRELSLERAVRLTRFLYAECARRRLAELPALLQYLQYHLGWGSDADDVDAHPADATWAEFRRLDHAALERNDADELKVLSIAAGLHSPDFDWSSTLAMILAQHADEEVRGNALLCFGHLARRFRAVAGDEVLAQVRRGLIDTSSYVRGQADSARDDIEFSTDARVNPAASES